MPCGVFLKLMDRLGDPKFLAEGTSSNGGNRVPLCFYPFPLLALATPPTQVGQVKENFMEKGMSASKYVIHPGERFVSSVRPFVRLSVRPFVRLFGVQLCRALVLKFFG
jgi:hypothetical protein